MDKDKNYKGYEVRSFGGDAELRAVDGDDSRVIEGYAVVFNSRSEVLTSWGDRFTEVISPGAINEELLRGSDVKALMEHNRERLLARWNKGVGTLTLSVDSKGLRFRFEAPKTIDGDTALELVRRGDIGGCSFAFRAIGEGSVEREWDKDKQVWHYTVRKITGLYDVTLTSDPAYSATSVSARSLEAPDVEPAGEKAPTIQELYKEMGNI